MKSASIKALKSVVKKNLKVNDLLKADEIFMTGTAAEVKSVTRVNKTKIGNGKIGDFTKELQELCKGAQTAWQSLGVVNYGRKSSEQGNIKFRRSLYFIRDIDAGETITSEHVRSIRPGFGMHPKFYYNTIGVKAKVNLERGMPLCLDQLDL